MACKQAMPPSAAREMMHPTLKNIVVLALCAAMGAQSVYGVDDLKMGAKPNEVRGDEITPPQRKAVEDGLAYLAQRQSKGGGYGYGGAAAGGSGGHAGITALCGLAFMSAGNLPGRGK